MERKLLKPIYECRCNGRLQSKRFTLLTGSVATPVRDLFFFKQKRHFHLAPKMKKMNCGHLLSGLLTADICCLAESPKDAHGAGAPDDASAAATADEYEDVRTQSAIAMVPDTANCNSISRSTTNGGSHFHARGHPDALGGQMEDRLAAFSTTTLKEKEEENSAVPTPCQLHGSWGPEQERMLHCLPAKQAGGDATIESLEILAYNDFLAVSSRMRLHEKEQEDPQKHRARPAARASTGRKQENPLKHRARLAARANTRWKLEYACVLRAYICFLILLHIRPHTAYMCVFPHTPGLWGGGNVKSRTTDTNLRSCLQDRGWAPLVRPPLL
jgi:hypothetical protein